MSSTRFWILVASVTWFLCGLAAGLLLAGVFRPDQPDPDPTRPYVDRMIAEFDMGPERARLFRLLMDEYQEEIERIKEQHVAQQASAMAPELERVGRRYNELVRDRVLTPDQRIEFDRLCSESP